MKGLRKFLLLIVLLLCNSFLNQAQTPTLAWQTMYGDQANSELGFASARLNNNLYLHAGYFESKTTFQVNPYLIFTDGNGNFLRDTLYHHIDEGKITGLARNEDGSFVACGMFKDSIGSPALFLFKGTQTGTIQWLRTFTGAMGNNQKVISLPDGYLIISSNQVRLIKTDLNGRQQWNKIYGQPLNSGGESIIPLPDGSYLATGWSNRGGAATVSNFHKLNYWLLKLKPNRDTIFTKAIGNSTNFEIGNSAAPTADGGVAVAGAYVQNISQTRRLGQVLKLDSLLNLQWELKVIPNGGNSDFGCEFFAIQPTSSGQLVVAGQNKQINFVQSYIARISPPLTTGGTASINWSQFIASGVDLKELLYEDDGSAVVSGTGSINFNGGGVAQLQVVKYLNLGQPFRPNYCTSPPQAQFTYQLKPDSLIFSQSSLSGLRYGVISKWEYLFGDGSSFVTYNSAKANRVGHFYQAQKRVPGTAVKLVVTNNLFCTDTLTLYPFGGGSTGILEKINNKTSLGQSFPNPTESKANISYSIPKAFLKAHIP